MFADLSADLRVSLRHLARTPAFTAAAVVVLALGIGLNAAVFGLAHALAFAGRPMTDPDALVQLYSRHATEVDSFRPFSYGAWQVASARDDVFSGVLAHTVSTVGLRRPVEPEARRTFAGFVSANYFDVLGVRIAAGRPFTDDEARAGSQALVALASHAWWRRTGADPGLVGSTVLVNERPVTIVGITPPGFTGTMVALGPELFLPLGAYDLFSTDLLTGGSRALGDPESFGLFLVGRLAPGLTPAAADSRLAPLAAAMAEAHPAQYRDRALVVGPLPRFQTGTSPASEGVVTTLALVFLGLTGAVLLIVCLNLATVLIARAQARRHEFAIRLALGGGRLRVVRQLMVEALLLGLAGAVGGVLLGAPAVDLFLATLLARLPIAIGLEAATTIPAMAAAFGFGVVAAVLFALGPALAQSGDDVLPGLKQHPGEAAPRRRAWLRHPLVTAQIALSLALLVAAGLFIRLARDGTAYDPGPEGNAVVLAEVDAAMAGYDQTRALPEYAAIEARLAALPGVAAAAVAVTVPFGSVHLGEDVRRAGPRAAAGSAPSTPEAGRAFAAKWNAIGSGYLDVMGMTLQRGRVFTENESRRPGAPPVALVDEILAGQLWPDGNALGQFVHVEDDATDAAAAAPAAVQIVGIVAPLRDEVFPSGRQGAIYVPFAQGYRSGVTFHVRPQAGGGAGLPEATRAAVRAVAPGVPLFGVTTYGAHLARSIEFWGLRTLAVAMSGVGAFAALIAVVGVYGAKAYAVSRRSREFGVRLAVGASPASVRRLVLGEAVRVGAVGVVVGSLLGLGVGRVLDALFVDLVAFDLTVAAMAPLLLLAACAAAAWVPARRAARVDPAVALRGD